MARTNRRNRGQPQGPVIAVEGPSGSGKSTVSRRWAQSMDAVWIPEAWARMRPRPSLSFRTPERLERLELALLLEDAHRYREARGFAADGGTVVVDTDFAGTLSYVWGLARALSPTWNVLATLTATARDLLRRGAWGLADRYFYLDTGPSTIAERVATSPRSHPSGWATRHAVVGSVEREFWLGSRSGGRSMRATRVNAGGPVDRVLAALERARSGEAPRPRPDASTVLAWFEARAGPRGTLIRRGGGRARRTPHARHLESEL